MIEQGMAGHVLPILDQTGKTVVKVFPPKPSEIVQNKKAIQAVGNRKKLFAREREGWVGYVSHNHLIVEIRTAQLIYRSTGLQLR